jgi:hypothetical protein
MLRNIIMMVLALVLAAGPAEAGDTAPRVGVSRGTMESTAFDLYLQHTFDPWQERAAYQFGPYANLGYTLWLGDKNKADNPEAVTDQIWGLVAAVGLRLDLKVWEAARPYLAFNVGPSYISGSDFLGRGMGGGHYLFNLRASLGLRFGKEYRHNLGLDGSHFSNAYTKSANYGYNSLGMSYGYGFW